MKITTWNIGGGLTSNDGKEPFTEDVDYFAGTLSSIDPDFICLQEVHTHCSMDHPAYIADRLGLNFVSRDYGDSHLKDGCRLGLAILSKWPLRDAVFKVLPNPCLSMMLRGQEVVSHDKGFLFANTTVNGRDLRIGSGHLFPFHRFGRNFEDEQFQNIRDDMDEMFLDPPENLIGADMNYADLSRIIPKTLRVYTDAACESTRPDGRVTDHVLYPRTWTCNYTQVIPGRADHYLLIADISC